MPYKSRTGREATSYLRESVRSFTYDVASLAQRHDAIFGSMSVADVLHLVQGVVVRDRLSY